jgi:ATP-binding cassette subfamily B protein
MLLAGFLLMLAGTAATLVPPYLTMPLMDEILIPFQNGKPIEQGTVLLLPGRPAGVGPGGLGRWAGPSTYMLALVSERIGADLRTTTYEHLLGCRWSTLAASAPAT